MDHTYPYTGRSKSFCAKSQVYSNNLHKIDDLKMEMAITEFIRNADRAILNTVFENTIRRVNKCLETGGGHFKHCCNQVHRNFLITLYYTSLIINLI
jgi:hypothetical protein